MRALATLEISVKRVFTVVLKPMLALALCLIPVSHLLAETGIQMHRTLVSETDASGWYPAVSTYGEFSVLLPLPFNDFSVPRDGDSDVLRFDAVSGKSIEGIKFVVMRSFYENNEIAKNYFSNSTDGKTFPNSEPMLTQYQTYDAVDTEVRRNLTSFFHRAIQVDNSIVSLIVEWPNEYESSIKPLAARFLDSLVINP
tara:strand:- start:1540 stop:2133 length:594 start_codon:yes stop_codon:yes gene_type:complete